MPREKLVCKWHGNIAHDKFLHAGVRRLSRTASVSPPFPWSFHFYWHPLHQSWNSYITVFGCIKPTLNIFPKMSDFLPSCPSLLPIPYCNYHVAFKEDFIHNMKGKEAKRYLYNNKCQETLKGEGRYVCWWHSIVGLEGK